MVISWRVYVASVILMGTMGTISAYIYEIQVFRIWNTERKQYQYVIGLSDYHDKTHAVNKTQRQHIQDVLVRAPHDKIKLVVEDLSSPNNQGTRSCGNYIIGAQEGILAGLAQFAQDAGVNTDNVEYRFCRVACLGPIVMQPQRSPEEFQITRSMPMSNLMHEVQTNISLTSEKINPQLKRVCDTEIAAVNTTLDALNLKAYKDSSVADFLMHISSAEQRSQLVKQLLIFDSALLDVKIMQSIARSTEPVIIVCAGGSHIARTGAMLQKVGYSQVARTSVTYYKEYDMKKCVAASVKQGSCVKPNPISLELLDQYLPR